MNAQRLTISFLKVFITTIYLHLAIKRKKSSKYHSCEVTLLNTWHVTHMSFQVDNVASGLPVSLLAQPDGCGWPIQPWRFTCPSFSLLKKFQKELGFDLFPLSPTIFGVVRFISDRIAVIYKGVIVEVAETEELFNNPVHPYTQALLSAVHSRPTLEQKFLKVYDPDQHDYETDKPSMVEIRPGHYVWANQAELERYKKRFEIRKSFVILVEQFIKIMKLFYFCKQTPV